MGVPERKPPAGLHDVASLKKLTQRVFCRNFHLYLNWLVYEHGLGRWSSGRGGVAIRVRSVLRRWRWSRCVESARVCRHL